MNDQFPTLDSALRTHEDVIERAREIGRRRGLSRVVVAAAEEDDVLAAIYRCRQEGIADAILAGRPDGVREALEIAGVPGEVFEIIPTSGDEESALRAAQIAGRGDADVVMKGFLKTSILLKTLLKSEHGLRDRELVSHSALLYVPRYGKFIDLTDGGTIPAPTFKQKLVVLANAVQVLRSVGVEKPRAAVLGPSVTVSGRHPETGEASALADIVGEHWGRELEIKGPLPFDRALEWGADILLVHNLEEGNILAKTLIQFGGAIFMGVIAGAKVPISLVSRSDTMINKMASVALAVCLADYQRRGLPAMPAIHLPEMAR